MDGDPFHIRSHVENFDDIVGDIVRRSAAARRDIPMIGDIRYGEGPGETLDLFFPQGPRRNLPVHLFIHGGYWRMFSKRDYSYIAQAITAAGAIAVIIDYALMPTVRLEVLVDQTRQAARWVTDTIASHGGDPHRLSVSGHSAGAHLASFLLHEDRPHPGAKTAFLLGGLYDLKPLQSSFLAAEIGLTDEEVRRFTPLMQAYDPACEVILAIGADETPPFHDQARQFAKLLQSQTVKVRSLSFTGQNHMSSVQGLGIPGTEIGQSLMMVLKQIEPD
ncbi:esterase [Xaviernesmea oryzae]|uniref:Esterase n=1 Tax=Xaviernesmea oryzae TaxID=464029 RepID=A0A1Q9AR16_9HYPH|nr:alpha/beta hydrolase [Xaviernesmea oryzae]OLP57883.1 esterase [Xaviernesmea oryzae]SEL32635.1 arylformamidase [Xaviernesmea oryzae]